MRWLEDDDEADVEYDLLRESNRERGVLSRTMDYSMKEANHGF